MNINATNIDTTNKTQEKNSNSVNSSNDNSANFSEELKKMENSSETKQVAEENDKKTENESNVKQEEKCNTVEVTKPEEKINDIDAVKNGMQNADTDKKTAPLDTKNKNKDVELALNGLNSIVEEISTHSNSDNTKDEYQNKDIQHEVTAENNLAGLNIFEQGFGTENMVQQSENKTDAELNFIETDILQQQVTRNEKNKNIFETMRGIKAQSEEKDEDETVINNNDLNVLKNKDILPQVSVSTGFSGDGQPFSSLMGQNEENDSTKNNVLSSTQSELEEESKILSTMSENIAIANKNNIIKDTVVKSDAIIMNVVDVEVFNNLVNGVEINMNNISAESVEKGVAVSKTLADMLAKSMENNKPFRIDFDNDISVIIKVSREGKISADFLPSSQVAEAYLKENLPLLRQRFEDNNIEYDELNQRNQKNRERENDNKKKGRRDE